MGACDACGNIFRLIIIGGCVVAFTLQWFMMYSCNFVDLGDGDTAGLWYLGSNGVCDLSQVYEAPDAIVNAARSVAILSMIGGFGAGVLVTFEWLCCNVCCAGCFESLGFLAAWVLGGATFMIYGSSYCVDVSTINTEPQCGYGSESIYNSFAVFLYFCCHILFCCTPEPDPICKQMS